MQIVKIQIKRSEVEHSSDYLKSLAYLSGAIRRDSHSYYSAEAVGQVGMNNQGPILQSQNCYSYLTVNVLRSSQLN
jgi:hypothetical protein